VNNAGSSNEATKQGGKSVQEQGSEKYIIELGYNVMKWAEYFVSL
jgi:hypothetical protein